MKQTQNSITRPDYIIAALLILIVGLCGYFHLDNTCYWGDDFAAYISEGIAIADGTLDQQTALNALMHPSYLPEDLRAEQVTYVWGYPLFLSVIYSLVGFDRVSFSTVIYYKLPSVICFALLAGVFYFFLRRRFPRPLSFVFSAAFAGYEGFYEFMDTLYSDIVFLFFFLLSLYLIELFLSERKPSMRVLLGVVSGIAMWYTYEVRLNGIAVLFAAALAQSISYIDERRLPSLRELPIELSSYISFAMLVVLSSFILPSPTKYSGTSFSLFRGNLFFYLRLIIDWFGLLVMNPIYVVFSSIADTLSYSSAVNASHIIGYVLLALCIVGVLFTDKRNLYLIFLAAVYSFAVCLLPYRQGMRYIYPLLPILLMFVGYGLKTLARFIRISTDFLHSKYAVSVLCAILSVFMFIPIVKTDIGVMQGQPKVSIAAEVSGGYRYNIYSEKPVAVYNYISENTPPDCKIGFIKPRALYLNTQRVSIPIGVNGHTLDEVDYLLCWKQAGEEFLTGEWRSRFTPVFSNAEFTLYEKQPVSAVK